MRFGQPSSKGTGEFEILASKTRGQCSVEKHISDLLDTLKQAYLPVRVRRCRGIEGTQTKAYRVSRESKQEYGGPFEQAIGENLTGTGENKTLRSKENLFTERCSTSLKASDRLRGDGVTICILSFSCEKVTRNFEENSYSASVKFTFKQGEI